MGRKKSKTGPEAGVKGAGLWGALPPRSSLLRWGVTVLLYRGGD